MMPEPEYMPEVRRRYEESFGVSPLTKMLEPKRDDTVFGASSAFKDFYERHLSYEPRFPPQPEWDMNDYSRDFEWLGQPREMHVQVADTQKELSRLACDLWRCTCAWPYPSCRLTMPWCEIHGEHLERHGLKRSRSGSFILLTSTIETFPIFEAINRDLADAMIEMTNRWFFAPPAVLENVPSLPPVTYPGPMIKPKFQGIMFGLGLTYADVAHLKERTRMINNDLAYFVDCSYRDDVDD